MFTVFFLNSHLLTVIFSWTEWEKSFEKNYVKYDQQFLAQEVAHGNICDCAAATLCISWPKNVQQEAGAFVFSIFLCSWFLPVHVMSRRGFDVVVLLCHHLLCEFLQRVVLSANCSHRRWLHVFVFLLLILSSTALITAWVCVRAHESLLQRGNNSRCCVF